ncbi:PadR family transcriptional regulator [Sphingomonas sp. MMS24-J13]|uniref:PadR family transcriptional regulator n=1 Tax=Sphingomonas sp. MMS24-J13 TaxID=3238686 RepID=UPI00384B7111
MIILGMLHRGDLHPYEIKRRLEAAMVECYLDLDVGTLYYAIRQLEKDGGIEAVAQERVARGGVRTIYRITDKGRAEFQAGFFRQFEDDGPAPQAHYGAMLFLHCVDPGRLAEAIRTRISRLDDLIAKLGPIREQMGPTLPLGGDFLFRHIERQRRMDREWLGELLEAVEGS